MLAGAQIEMLAFPFEALFGQTEPDFLRAARHVVVIELEHQEDSISSFQCIVASAHRHFSASSFQCIVVSVHRRFSAWAFALRSKSCSKEARMDAQSQGGLHGLLEAGE
jgi:hypothetical protein